MFIIHIRNEGSRDQIQPKYPFGSRGDDDKVQFFLKVVFDVSNSMSVISV